MRDVHDACREWLEGQDGSDKVTEFDVEELEIFVRAQRISAARDVLERVARVLSGADLEMSTTWKPLEVAEAIRTIRDAIEREEA